jgi:hypothetical protein
VSARAIARGAVVSDATLLRRGRGPLVDDRVATGPRRDRGLASPVHCTEVEASTGSTPPPTTMERVMKKLVSISVCSSLVLGIGCAEAPNDRGDDDDDPGTTSVYLASSVVRASNGAACGAAASPANTADQADCLTIESTWGGAGATPENAENAARSLVYTGIDATTDAVLVGREKAFAKGFPDAGGRPVAAVYGAHGEPGWIQGLPDNAGAQGQGSILRVGFGGARGIPLLALSTCWAGNTGEHATRRQLTQNPRTYLNNIAPASFVSTYFSIPSDNIVACKNGTVRPTESELFCTQEKRQLPGEAQARVRGDATVIKGDGTARGTATAGRDYVFTMQTKTDTVPSRSFTAVNIPLRRVDEADYPADSPWKQEPRSCPENMGCRIQDKYPMFTTFPMQVPAGGPSSFYLSGQFLTASIIIETPSGARLSPSSATASADGRFAQFQFTPTGPGRYKVWVTDLDGLENDPHDVDYPYESFQATSYPVEPPPDDDRDAGPGGGSGSPDAGVPLDGPPVIDPPVIDPPVIDPPVIDPPVLDPPVLESPETDPPVLAPIDLDVTTRVMVR